MKRGRILRRGGRRFRFVSCAQIRDQIADILVGYGVTKGRHFLTAIENLIRDFFGRPRLVSGQAGERRRLLCSDTSDSVALGAAFVAEQDSAGFFFVTLFGGGACGWVSEESN